MPWFRPPFFARKKEIRAADLPAMSRISTLESDLLAVRGDLGKILTTVKTLQGKVYRGVQLGETADSAEEAPAAPVEQMALSTSKAELYQRAAQLRRH